MKGRTKEAWKVFSRMAEGNGGNLSDFVSEEEFHETFTVKNVERNAQSFFGYAAQLLEIFKGVYGKVTFCLIITYTGLQIMGNIGSAFFLPQFLSNLTVSFYFSIFVAFVTQIPGILIMAALTEFGYGSYTLVFPPIVLFVLSLLQTSLFRLDLLIFIYSFLVVNLFLIHIYISNSFPINIRVLTVALFYSIQGVQAACNLVLKDLLNLKFWMKEMGFIGFLMIVMWVSILGALQYMILTTRRWIRITNMAEIYRYYPDL